MVRRIGAGSVVAARAPDVGSAAAVASLAAAAVRAVEATTSLVMAAGMANRVRRAPSIVAGGSPLHLQPGDGGLRRGNHRT